MGCKNFEQTILAYRRGCGCRPFGVKWQAAARAAAMAEKLHDIQVEVATEYLPDQSEPAASRYVFAYTITITNAGSVPAQLISRHWIIADADGKVQEVRGLGVVGHQPLLKPGEHFEYTSGSALATPVGTMRGSYHMVAEDGTQFEAPIPEFVLSMPRTLH
jgi:ApaG protein